MAGHARRRVRALACSMTGLLLLGLAPAVRAELYTLARWGFGAYGSRSTTGTTMASIPGDSFGDGIDVVGFASAAAHAGYLGMGTAAAFSTMNQFPTAISGADANAVAESQDVVTPHGLPAGTPGYLVYKLAVSGTNSSVIGPTHSGDHITMGGAGVYSVLLGVTCPESEIVPPTGAVPSCDEITTGPLRFDSISYDHVPAELPVPILFETTIGVYLIMTSEAGIAFDPTVAETFDGATSFGGTIEVTSLELQDANHQPVPGASLSATSGTDYPIAAGGTTTTLPGGGTTTTLPAGAACGGVAGLVRARCKLDAALDTALCADPIPRALMHTLHANLAAADGFLRRAIGASGAKQAHLVKKVRHDLRVVAARTDAAAGTKRAKRHVSPTCAATIDGIVADIVADLV
ncbi:MAG TPA: hypothetical protein VMS22_09480 [Candidatus Eisenbacteria bacterium]|nr:hypothetical protein [Candidatus Eisenbacteria bacterium]